MYAWGFGIFGGGWKDTFTWIFNTNSISRYQLASKWHSVMHSLFIHILHHSLTAGLGKTYTNKWLCQRIRGGGKPSQPKKVSFAQGCTGIPAFFYICYLAGYPFFICRISGPIPGFIYRISKYPEKLLNKLCKLRINELFSELFQYVE